MSVLQASPQASSSASRGVGPAGSSNRPSRALRYWQSFVQRSSALARPLSHMKMHLQPEVCFRRNMLERQPDVMQGFFTWQSVKIALLFTNLSPGPPSERLGMRRSGVWPGLAASARDMELSTFSIKIRECIIWGVCGTYCLCGNYSTPRLWSESSHRGYVNEWVRLGTNKTFFTRTGVELPLALGVICQLLL